MYVQTPVGKTAHWNRYTASAVTSGERAHLNSRNSKVERELILEPNDFHSNRTHSAFSKDPECVYLLVPGSLLMTQEEKKPIPTCSLLASGTHCSNDSGMVKWPSGPTTKKES